MSNRLLLLRDKYKPLVDLTFLGSLPNAATFTRASTATYFDSAGVLQTAAINTPRFDYDPAAHVIKGLLIENTSRTNVFLNSGSPATQSIAVTAQAYTLSFYGTGSITRSGTSSGTTTGTGALVRTTVTFTPTAGTLTLTLSGSITYPQLEAGSFATSYIPAGATAVTRAAESLVATNIPWFNFSQGAIAVDFRIDYIPPASVWPAFAAMSDGTTNERVRLAANNGGTMNVVVISGGAQKLNIGSDVITYGANTKYAMRYKASYVAVCANGGTPSGGTPTGWPTGMNQYHFCGFTNASSDFNGYLRRFRYWNYELPNAILQKVTQ